jgi:hypothetical protein
MFSICSRLAPFRASLAESIWSAHEHAVDASGFPTGGREIAYETEDLEGLAARKAAARAHVARWVSSPPIAELVVAFGIAPVIGLFRVRFASPSRAENLGERVGGRGGRGPEVCSVSRKG